MTLVTFSRRFALGTAMRGIFPVCWGLVVAFGCERSVEVLRLTPSADVSTSNDAGSGSDAPASDTAASDTAGATSDAAGQPTLDGSTCVIRPCRGRVLVCGNCIDDDGDGLIDAEDPDCWGECNDSESAWAGRQVCSNLSCYFDRDCGLGNDEQCADLTPNGCDCYGCCEVPGRTTPIFLGTRNQAQQATCSTSAVADEVACGGCELDERCFNPCEPGEVCFPGD